MALEVRYENKSRYLSVEISGQWDNSDSSNVVELICAEAHKCRQTRLLFDVRNLTPTTSGMTLFFAGELIAQQLAAPFRTAVLWLPEYYDGFGETVARNRGASIRVFFDKPKALKWLLRESK